MTELNGAYYPPIKQLAIKRISKLGSTLSFKNSLSHISCPLFPQFLQGVKNGKICISFSIKLTLELPLVQNSNILKIYKVS